MKEMDEEYCSKLKVKQPLKKWDVKTVSKNNGSTYYVMCT